MQTFMVISVKCCQLQWGFAVWPHDQGFAHGPPPPPPDICCGSPLWFRVLFLALPFKQVVHPCSGQYHCVHLWSIIVTTVMMRLMRLGHVYGAVVLAVLALMNILLVSNLLCKLRTATGRHQVSDWTDLCACTSCIVILLLLSKL